MLVPDGPWTWGLTFSVRLAWRRIVKVLRLERGQTVANVFNVAKYILEQRGSMTTMKLQKLLYYCQAWHLVRGDAPLFTDEIQAWAAGPVVRSVFAMHRGRYTVGPADLGDSADSSQLSDDEKKTILKVLDRYGHMTAAQLSDLSHSERPWIEARSGLGPTDRGEATISPSVMADYYTALALNAD
jgi:uncharacterized phage-associated protein